MKKYKYLSHEGKIRGKVIDHQCGKFVGKLMEEVTFEPGLGMWVRISKIDYRTEVHSR